MIELILILATHPQAAPYRPQALPWTPMQIIKVPVTAEVKREPTDAEKDAAYLKENHWRLGPSSCSMLNCPAHRQWELAPGPASAVGTVELPAAGHWEQRRAGLFRVRRVWIPDASPAPAIPLERVQDAAPVMDGTTDGAPVPVAGCPTHRGGG